MDISKVIDKKIDYWKKKLIDLSKRNNLVRYRFTKSKSLKIISPSFSKVIEDLENEQNIFILKEKKDNALHCPITKVIFNKFGVLKREMALALCNKFRF